MSRMSKREFQEWTVEQWMRSFVLAVLLTAVLCFGSYHLRDIADWIAEGMEWFREWMR